MTALQAMFGRRLRRKAHSYLRKGVFRATRKRGVRRKKIYFRLRLVLNKNDPYLPLIDLAC
jgi:hypothetical protein